ncbi:MAG: hypothetical protein WCR52_06360 [Bacteroidota bacterium]
MKKILFFVAAFALAGFAFQSCKKDADTTDYTAEKVVAEDVTAHNDVSEQIDYDADVAIDAFMGAADDRGACPTVTFAQPKGTWPNTITLDYSDAGCTNNAGHTVKGKIVITQTNPMSTQGASRSFTFENFSFDGVKVEGTKKVTNAGLNAAGQRYFTVVASETLTYPNGTVSTHTANRTRTQIEGAATTLRADDVWSVTGSASGTNRNGVAYTVTITNPLIKKVLCPWISQGTIEITANNKTRSIDYGDGACDKDATLTLPDGTVKEVKIRHFWWK